MNLFLRRFTFANIVFPVPGGPKRRTPDEENII